jgi:hypothetical protein
MTDYHKTIPSAVLGEYLADVQRFYDYTEASSWSRDINRDVVSKSLFGRKLLNAWGEQVARDYWRWMLNRAKSQRRAEYEQAQAKRQQQAAKVEALKVKKPQPKRKPWQDARRINEYRMREAILKVVRRHGWTDVGIRKLADLAGMKHRTARTVLDRMAADGQVKLDDSWGQGKRTGVYVLRDHPCWSDHKHTQSLALSKLSSQVEG